VRATLRGLLGYLLDHLELLRLLFIDVFEVGPVAKRRVGQAIDAFVGVVIDHAPAPRCGTPIARPALAGALHAILSSCVGGQRMARLASIVDQLAFVVLAPYLGARAAIVALEEAHAA
jgi:hypothetical protein